MKVLLLYIPSRYELIEIPYGLLYVSNSILEEGHEVKIINLAVDRMKDDTLLSCIKDYAPRCIGIGALPSGYLNLKRISLRIKERFPGIPLIAGGIVASMSKILLEHTPIEIVVHGEGEIIIKNILRALTQGDSYHAIRGISYRTQDGTYKRNEPEFQIRNLDSIPLPPYHLIDVKRHCTPVNECMDPCCWEGILTESELRRIKSKNKWRISIVSSRGCTGRCSFCYRSMRGFRQFSPEYVIQNIKFIQNKYDIHYFRFIDELFNASKKWCLKFCDLLDEEKIDITYIIDSLRVDNIDEHLLRRLKETGCIRIAFGFESATQSILSTMQKGTTVEQNYEAARLGRKVGIYIDALMVIGFPDESPRTIHNNIKFLTSTLPETIYLAHLTPYPGTRDWNYCLKKGIIKNEENFILGYNNKTFWLDFKVNMTNYPGTLVKQWKFDICEAVKLARLKAQRRYVSYLIYKLYYKLGIPLLKYIAPDFVKRRHQNV